MKLMLFLVLLTSAGLVQGQYCVPEYTTGTDAGDYIDGVVLEDIDNTSSGESITDVGYSDYTDLSTVLTPGLSYTMDITNNPTWSQTYTAWIDYNQNEEFEDDEVLGNLSLAAGESGTIDFDMSVTALPGETRLRVRCIYPSGLDTPLDPCESVTFGETEDYTIIVPASGDNDIGVTDIVSLFSGCGLTEQELTVEVYNLGLETVADFDVAYVVEHPVLGTLPEVVEAYDGPALASLESAEFTFATLVDLTEVGDYTITAYTIFDLDESAINDTSDFSLTSIPVISSFPYTEDFEDGSGGWVSDGVNSSWELGYPSASVIDGPPPSTPLSENSWATSLFDYYNINEDSWVQGPCFDFTDLSLPYVQFDIWWEIYDFWDGARLEYSLDAGDTWEVIGGIGTGENWYSDECFSFDFDPDLGFYNPAWTASGGGWVTAKHDISFLAGESQVQLRIRFKSYAFTGFSDGVAFDNFFVGDPADIDLGVNAVVAPANGCGLSDAETVIVEIRNFGAEPQSDVPVSFQVDGGAVVSETWIGTIEPGEIVEYTFTGTADVEATGDHEIIAWTTFVGDTATFNDTTVATITNIPVIASFPYFQDFEGGADGWTSGGEESSWELGSPSGFVIDGPPDTDPDSENSWMTNLTDYYNNDESSWVLGPCFDFSSLILPYVQLDINWNTEGFWDGAQLQYSLDAGTTWEVVGDFGTGDFWYTGTAIALDSEYGWVGSGSGWVTAYHDISELAGETQVQFRMYFATDGSVNFYDGIAFDNFLIADPLGDDIGVIAILDPSSGADLGDEEVTIEIENFGTNAQSDFLVSYQLDGGAIVTETFDDELSPGEIASYTFTTLADMAAYGPYDLCAWTELAGEEDLTNDSICKPVTNFEFLSYYIYSNTTGGEPWFSTANSDAMDAVFDDAWLQEFFETVDVEDVFSDGTCFVFLEGSDSHANELEDFLDDNIEIIEDWVEAGGRLFLNAAPNEGSGLDFGFDGTELIYSYFTSNAEAYDEDHPIFEGPFTPVGTSWTGTSFGHARLEGDFDTLIVDEFSPDNVVAAEKAWGDGVVIFGGMTTTNYHSPGDEAFNLRANIISYLSICEATSPVDLAMLELVSPESGCGLGEEIVTVEIENLSGTAVTDVDVSFTVDGGTPVTETILDVIDAFSTYTYTFTATADLSAAGDHIIETSVSIPGDIDPSNDDLSTTVSTLETPLIDLPENGTFCDELELDAGNPGATYLWSTGATTQEIIVTESGTYSVTVTNPATGCTATDAVEVAMEYSPVASFTYTATGLDVTFTNTSTGGASYSWSFGDGETSSEDNPDHSYASPGLYNVTLTVSNGCGNDVYTTQISVATSIEDLLAGSTEIYPNPTAGLTIVQVDFDAVYEVQMEIVNQLGQVVWSNIPGGIQTETFEVDLSDYADGIYTLKVQAGDHRFSKPIILTK